VLSCRDGLYDTIRYVDEENRKGRLSKEARLRG